jgi:hypothetical protein
MVAHFFPAEKYLSGMGSYGFRYSCKEFLPFFRLFFDHLSAKIKPGAYFRPVLHPFIGFSVNFKGTIFAVP